MRDKDKPKRAKQLASIDGMVSDSRQLGGVPRKGRKTKKAAKSEGLTATAHLAEGFHPMRQSPGGLGNIDQPDDAIVVDDDQPIVLDEKPKKKPSKDRHVSKRAVIKHLLLASLAFIIVGGIAFGANLFLAYKHVLHGGGNAPALAANVDINQLKGEGDGRINVLLLGIGGRGHDGPNLTDTILLVSIDPVNHKTVLLSVPRDLWVHIPGAGYDSKINAAYPYGLEQSGSKNGNRMRRAGIAELDKTLKPILGVPIHYHAIVSFKAFRDGVDALGGVSVNVPKTLYDPTIAWENNYNPTIAKKGIQKFNGAKALLYAKSRETSSDFDRGQRQRLLLTAMKDKILSVGTFSNPVRLSKLLNSFGNNVYTDFSLSDLTRLYQIISEVPSDQIKSVDLVTPPHQLLTTGNIGGQSIVQPLAGTFNYSAIQVFVHKKLVDSFILKENAAVAIYNATSSPGLATRESKILKSYGYRVTVIANAPSATNPDTPSVIDLSNNQAPVTKHYLENRFHTTAQGSVPSDTGINPPAGTGFVIILGRDNH